MKTFKITTDSENFGTLLYRVGANTKEEAQEILIKHFPSIEGEDGDFYHLLSGKNQIVDSIQEMRGVEMEHGIAERIYPEY